MSAVALCPRCQRETLPALKEPSWHRDVHRAAARDMIAEPDPRAEKKRELKEQKRAKKQPLRAATREGGFLAAAKLFLVTKAEQSAAPDEDCPDCRRIQDRRRGAA